ncbi:MAG: 3-deoxy-7-phosphoheptulonate synthase, partial [Pseudomonadota bacterium]
MQHAQATTLAPEPSPVAPPRAIEMPSPELLKARYALSGAEERRIATHRSQLIDVFNGRDDRLAVIVGPCSIHDVDEAWEYADRLAALANSLDDVLMIAMWVYIEKPRSTVGWRGLVFDPALDGSRGPDAGVAESRRLMQGIVAAGLPIATETLDPFVVPYVSDLLTFTSIGARTAMSQTHRQLAASMAC